MVDCEEVIEEVEDGVYGIVILGDPAYRLGQVVKNPWAGAAAEGQSVVEIIQVMPFEAE